MKDITLKATVRTEKGASAANKARREGRIPAVVYGPNVHKLLYLDRLETEKVVYSPETYLVKLDLDGEIIDTVIREVQYHPVHDFIIHVDFYAVPSDVPVTVNLPIKLTGLAEGVKVGGKLVQLVRTVRVKGLIKDLPSAVEVDVTSLKLGKSFLVKDLPADLPFRVRMSPTVALAKVEIPRALRVGMKKG